MTTTLYGCANSRSLRAAWALEEAGAGYDYVAVDLFKGEQDDRAFRALNPAGRVPVLVDDGITLTESAAIVLYIAEQYPASRLFPAVQPARADCLRWCFFIATELEQPLWTIARHRFALPRDKRVPDIEPTARWEFGNACAVFEHALDREFIVGNALSAADILAGHTLAWARSAKIDLPYPRIDAYLDRLYARSALKRARARESTEKRG